MKKNLLLLALFSAATALKAQKIDSIYVNLYTDSLKKGTYNYINIEAKLSNGRYLPLDSTDIQFTASAGKFFGNSLYIDKNFTPEKVHITVVLKKNPLLHKEFDMWIKTREDNEPLKTADEIINGIKKDPGKKKRNS